ncbi:hypothetical protein N7931_15690 [Catenovulum sp. 2E275]|uniref:hypothetical protein n=1 Tax=Catenovulum sp. 2E275 TaxID=2980497 RepID=UPI0021D24C1C|nr:hypothetical protein [Catenovulum sp. 2E275]MCU4677076.1 hypothetical protein [Catenovulum sp. 2E275]
MNKLLKFNRLIALGCSFAISCIQFVYAKDSTLKANFDLESGVEYDSKLTVVELDQLKEEADIALKFAAKAKFNWQATQKLTVKGGYTYSNKDYKMYDEFDLIIHQLSAEANYDFSVIKLGALHYLSKAELAGEDFLNLNQSSLFLSKLMDNKHYLRFSINFTDKKLDDFSSRNSIGKGYSADYFLFENQAKSFFSISIHTDKQSADSTQFNYYEQGINTKMSHQFDRFSLPQKIQLSVSYWHRDYTEITPLIGRKRDDKKQGAELSWFINLNEYITLHNKLEYADYHSNLNTADYHEYLASIQVKAAF